jgi:hypothetical protein
MKCIENMVFNIENKSHKKDFWIVMWKIDQYCNTIGLKPGGKI